MQQFTQVLMSLLILFAGIFAVSGAMANPYKQMGGMYGMQPAGMAGYGKHMGSDRGGMHHGHHYGHHGHHSKLLSPHWKTTLTPEQRYRIDKMHLDFTKAKMTLKSKVKALKTELAILSTADQPDSAAIDSKIEELLDVKKNIMRIRYSHIVNMRSVLNNEQRLSYDLDVLKRAKLGKKGKGRHH
ncbi:MAG: periplasmic heavy metal sensor [Candidatus Thiodiazotropha endolucinida]